MGHDDLVMGRMAPADALPESRGGIEDSPTRRAFQQDERMDKGRSRVKRACEKGIAAGDPFFV
jgi:hypothetical protein